MHDDWDEWHANPFGPAAYGAFAFIGFMTLVFLLFELMRRKTLSLLDKGYYFLDTSLVGAKRNLIPVRPENVDASDPRNPRVINPGLIDPCDGCCC